MEYGLFYQRPQRTLITPLQSDTLQIDLTVDAINCIQNQIVHIQKGLLELRKLDIQLLLQVSVLTNNFKFNLPSR